MHAAPRHKLVNAQSLKLGPLLLYGTQLKFSRLSEDQKRITPVSGLIQVVNASLFIRGGVLYLQGGRGK